MTMGNCRSKNDDSVDSNKSSSVVEQDNIEGYIVQQSSSPLSSGPNPVKTENQPDEVILSIKAEVNDLLEKINNFQGTTKTDKNFRYLDEMLTRCILRLDKIECNNSTVRSNRKQTIKGIDRAIAILEKKLEFNYDLKKLENNLSSAPETKQKSER